MDAMSTHARKVSILPTHCINEQAELEGFSVSVDGSKMGSILPVNRSMFMGHSLFECHSATSATLVNNKEVVHLQNQGEGRNTTILTELIRSIEQQSHGHEASFDCAPDNADTVAGMHGSSLKVTRSLGKRAVDSGRWFPEAPQVVGLYHAMVRGFQKDIRQHKLFVGVSGGCTKCCDSFYNLMLDVGHKWTCAEIAQSEEVWWLRKACQRSRCMIAKSVADAFNLRIQCHKDVHGYDSCNIGVPTVDTVEFDISYAPLEWGEQTSSAGGGGGVVTLYNAACDTTTVQNGLLCHMHPSEGFWLFKGTPRSSSRGTSFGSMFGSGDACGIFPTRSPCYRPGMGSPNYVHGFDTSIVSRLNSTVRTKSSATTVYQCFDEAFMRNLETMGWNRDHGVVELVPIAVSALSS